MNIRSLQTMLAGLAGGLRRVGPYLLVELLLPGGTVLALLLYLSRRRRSARKPGPRLAVSNTVVPMKRSTRLIMLGTLNPYAADQTARAA
jgi:uncharacterized iron-regulated membrane protein